MEKEKKINISSKVILLIAVICCVMAYFFIPSVNRILNKIFVMFASGDFTEVKQFISSYGVYAAAISFALMVLQSVMAPLPAFVLTFANANLFGWWQGAILSWSSAMAGAALCFYIARILGRDVAEKLTSKAGLKQVDEFFEKYGNNTILICRLLPFVSFDIVSYAAGLTSMSFWDFFIILIDIISFFKKKESVAFLTQFIIIGCHFFLSHSENYLSSVYALRTDFRASSAQKTMICKFF